MQILLHRFPLILWAGKEAITFFIIWDFFYHLSFVLRKIFVFPPTFSTYSQMLQKTTEPIFWRAFGNQKKKLHLIAFICLVNEDILAENPHSINKKMKRFLRSIFSVLLCSHSDWFTPQILKAARVAFLSLSWDYNLNLLAANKGILWGVSNSWLMWHLIFPCYNSAVFSIHPLSSSD